MNGAVAHDRSAVTASDCQTLLEVLQQRAANEGNGIAYTFLAAGAGDARSITWADLDRRAKGLGALLTVQGANQQRVLLALPSGMAFIEALFACWYAGAIAVPVSLPRHRRVKHRLHKIIADAGAHLAISTTDLRQRLIADGANPAAMEQLTWIDADARADAESHCETPHGQGGQVALLQYTSGSTGDPRGVMVTHANLMRNSALIAEACGHGPADTIGGWLPLFHDMGLIGLVVQCVYSGARCIFMPPERFLMRPWLWLQMISDYRICSSPAPNFAYDLCVDRIDETKKASLDFSGWRNALNGSEPIRPATLNRFASAFSSCGFKPEAFFPCYGLAEATLFVTGPGKDRQLKQRSTDGTLLPAGANAGHVGCGRTYGDTQLAIIDPTSGRNVEAGKIGEILAAGESCAQGYWNNAAATAATFGYRLAETADSSPSWLRTGDLGFIADGDLFITGRLRDLIILSGRNHFPVDLERTVESADPAIAPSGAAAISVECDGLERLVIVAELKREAARASGPDQLLKTELDAIVLRIRSALSVDHDVFAHDIILLRPGALPRTTSGKMSRASIREAYLAHTLERFGTTS